MKTRGGDRTRSDASEGLRDRLLEAAQRSTPVEQQGPLPDLVAGRLAESPEAPRVAVVVPPAGHWLPDALRAAVPDARVTEVVGSPRLREMHLELAPFGDFDLVVDVARGKKTVERFSAVFLHTRPGAAMIVRLPADGRIRQTAAAWFEELGEASRSGDLAMPGPSKPGNRDVETTRRNDYAALAASVVELRTEDDYVVVVNRSHALAKVSELALNALLEAKGGPDRVIETIDGLTWDSRCVVRSNSEERLAELPASYDAPELSLREYHHAVCLPQQVVVKDNLVLPESFRYNARKRLRSIALPEWGHDFVGAQDVECEDLPGSWFHLDNLFRGHFGHATAEQISHLWGWKRAKELDPSVRALVFLNRSRRMAQWEYDLWAAGGIAPEDIVMAEGPVRVERLYTASPMLSEPDFVHPGIEATYAGLGAALGSALAEQAGEETWPERLFVSRRIRRRWCTNTAEVEALFAARGFRVIYPEDYPLAQQVRFFREAEVIAGFSGSGMFQMAFTGGPRHIILVGSESYRRQNEYMMASVVGHRVDMVVCRAHVDETGRTPVKDSDFTFDPNREGVFLREVLDQL